MAASGRVFYTIRFRIFFVLYIFDFQHIQISTSNESPVLHTNKITRHLLTIKLLLSVTSLISSNVNARSIIKKQD
jgi:hypothetical protein